MEVGLLPGVGATRQGEVSVGFAKACLSWEDLARDAERWGSGHQGSLGYP